ncbi:hypothetical protein I4U23_031035 [Adineta vaga]|nr:hypothetical protein I4U23_031035 [Adineta vaga]
MVDVIQQQCNNNDQQEQKQSTSNNSNDTSTLLMDQIQEQLILMRQDDDELTEKLMSVYNGLCQLRQSMTTPQLNSNTDIAAIPAGLDSPSLSRYPSKQRSDSEPNILSDRQRMITVIEELQ